MTCREVERRWADRLDEARPGVLPVVGEGLSDEERGHLDRCPRCRSRVAGASALAQAIAALEPPRPPADLADRILAAVRADERPGTLPLPTAGRPASTLFVRRLAAVAAVVGLAMGLRAWWPIGVDRPDRPASAPTPAPALAAEPPPRPLTEAMAEMAEVAEAIARRTSEPAARLGRSMLGPAATAAAAPAPADPGRDAAVGPDVDGPADRVVKLIGDRLEAGVRPLSRPTRSAFSFLLPSLPPAEEPPAAEGGA